MRLVCNFDIPRSLTPNLPRPLALGFKVGGLGFRFKVWGLGFRVGGLGFKAWGLGFKVGGLGFKVWGLGCRLPRHLGSCHIPPSSCNMSTWEEHK